MIARATQRRYDQVIAFLLLMSFVVTCKRSISMLISSFDGRAFYLKQRFQSERVVECRLFGLPSGSREHGVWLSAGERAISLLHSSMKSQRWSRDRQHAIAKLAQL